MSERVVRFSESSEDIPVQHTVEVVMEIQPESSTEEVPEAPETPDPAPDSAPEPENPESESKLDGNPESNKESESSDTRSDKNLEPSADPELTQTPESADETEAATEKSTEQEPNPEIATKSEPPADQDQSSSPEQESPPEQETPVESTPELEVAAESTPEAEGAVESTPEDTTESTPEPEGAVESTPEETTESTPQPEGNVEPTTETETTPDSTPDADEAVEPTTEPEATPESTPEPEEAVEADEELKAADVQSEEPVADELQRAEDEPVQTDDELPDDFLQDLPVEANVVANGFASHANESDTDNLKEDVAHLSKTLDHLATKFDIFLEQSSRPGSTFGFGTLDQSLKGTNQNLTIDTSSGNLHHKMAYYNHKFPPIYLKGNEQVPSSDPDLTTKEEDFGDEPDSDGDENKERGNWSNHADFILSCLGYAVGLGNVWRFPYLCYKNGGGAFLIPYFIMLIFVGIPIVYLEISLGQFTSQGCVTCWNFAPIFTGVGIAHYLISFFINIYYNVIIAWSFYYFFASFTDKLPWAYCDNYWNTPLCRDRMPDVFCNTTDVLRFNNGTCLNTTTQIVIGIWNNTAANENKIIRRSASLEYYEGHVLKKSTGFEEFGEIQWEMALTLLVTWLVVFFCLFKGVKSSGKAVWFTAIFPYIVLLILLIRGVTLEGYYDGILFYTTPDFERLKDSTVWKDAAVQIFFSLSACMGGLITLASYNKFQNNCLRDTLIVCVGNSATSIFAGFAIFSFLGYQAHELGTTVDKVAEDGPGLAFVLYPDVLTKMPVSPIWAILFFLMLITLGLDSAFAGVEACVTGLADWFPSFFRGGKRKTALLAGVCFVTYLLGLSMAAEGGVYMVTLFDNSAGGWGMLVVGICESFALCWVYGPRRIVADLRTMCGDTILLAGPLPYWWITCWGVITPALLTGILIFMFVDWGPSSLGDYVFPVWADTLGLLMTILCVIFIPIYAIYALATSEGTFLQRLWDTSSPTADWGPALPKHRRLVKRYTPNFEIYPEKLKKVKSEDAEKGQKYDNPAFDF